MSPNLTITQQHILQCLRLHDGRFSRSELAKLLVGSTSSRVGGFTDNPFYGRLSGQKRKEVLAQIDSLVQQGLLVWDEHHNVIRLPDSKEQP